MAEDIERNLIRLSEAEAERLVKFYAEAEREILDRMNRALLRGNKTEYLAQMKKNVEAILEDLRAGNRTWCEEAIPRVYSQGL
jgi:DNA repair photolyase